MISQKVFKIVEKNIKKDPFEYHKREWEYEFQVHIHTFAKSSGFLPLERISFAEVGLGDLGTISWVQVCGMTLKLWHQLYVGQY